MIYFCTYFDRNYLSRFLTLLYSLNKFKFSYTFFVLALDDEVLNFFNKNHIENIEIIKLADLEREFSDLLLAKNNRDLIEYYFTLSPFLPRYINKKFNISKISYLDSDFYFLKSPQKKIEDSSEFSVVLLRQYSDKKYGLYNVGWIYFNFEYDETKKIIEVWSEQCFKLCTDLPHNGYYADQKYLDDWVDKLKNIKIEEPENYCLSPWDDNDIIENNAEKTIAFHFHGLEKFNNGFVSGFSKYNKKISKNIINQIYLPYLKKLISIEKNFNINVSSIRNLSNNKYKFFLKKIRKFKSYLKQKFYNDFNELK